MADRAFIAFRFRGKETASISQLRYAHLSNRSEIRCFPIRESILAVGANRRPSRQGRKNVI